MSTSIGQRLAAPIPLLSSAIGLVIAAILRSMHPVFAPSVTWAPMRIYSSRRILALTFAGFLPLFCTLIESA